MTKQILYIGDPMCSWCYGFSPVIREIYRTYKDEAQISLVVGGLHVGDNCVQDEKRIAFLRHHWEEIQERTGQPFNFQSLKSKGWIYDTEPACRAVVAVRKLDPDLVFPFFATVQSNFYAQAMDSNSDATYENAAKAHGLDGKTFLETFNDGKTRKETMNDFHWSRTMGVSGYPTVLLNDSRGWAALTYGYQPLSALEQPLENWLRADELAT